MSILSIGITRAATAKTTARSSSFLGYIHNFRFLAIVIIVVGHAIDFLSWEHCERLGIFLVTILNNGTVYFVFIAGFLFQFLSAKYEYKSYLKKKFQYVILPYLVVSLPAILYCLEKKSHLPLWFSNYFSGWPLLGQVLMLYCTGIHLPHFWFIPMIFLFYIASPILLWIDKHPKVYWILPLLLALSVFIPRPSVNDTLISFIHFFSVYVLGIFCCHYRMRLMLITKRIWPLLITIVAILTAVETAIMPSNYSLPFSINVVSKSISCIVLLYFLWRSESYISEPAHRFMGLIADLSFGIYFLHFYFMQLYYDLARFHLNGTTWLTQASPFTFSLLFIFAMSLSIGSLLLARNVFGEKSRFIVGC